MLIKKIGVRPEPGRAKLPLGLVAFVVGPSHSEDLPELLAEFVGRAAPLPQLPRHLFETHPADEVGPEFVRDDVGSKARLLMRGGFQYPREHTTNHSPEFDREQYVGGARLVCFRFLHDTPRIVVVDGLT